VQHLADRDGDHPSAHRLEVSGQLRDPGRVRTATVAHVHGVVDLEHVAAVERAWRLDGGNPVALGDHSRLGCGDLGTPAGRS
jgi:hypothetical protein